MTRPGKPSQPGATHPAPKASRVRHHLWSAGVLVFLGLFFCGVSGVQAQAYGQWWWQGLVGVQQSETESFVDGECVREFSLSGLRLEAEANGYIIHPNLSSFKLRLEGLLSKVEGGPYEDLDELGGRLELKILPNGSIPVWVYYGHRNHEYSADLASDPQALGRFAGVVQEWGGSTAFRTGFLRGLALDVASTRVELVDPDEENGSTDDLHLRWGRSIGKGRLNAFASNRQRVTAGSGVDRDSLSTGVSYSLRLPSHLSWESRAYAGREELAYAGFTNKYDDYRWFNRLTKFLRENDLWEIDADLRQFEPDGSDATTTVDVKGRYRWHVKPGFQVMPFVSLVSRSGEDLDLTSPRAGLSLSWLRDARNFKASVRLNSSAGSVSGSSGGRDLDEQSWAASLLATLDFGEIARLRKRFELELAKNELDLRSAEPQRLGDDSFGLPRTYFGQDYLRARVGVDQARAVRSWSAWVEWSRIDQARDVFSGGEFSMDSYLATARFTAGGLGLMATAGEVTVDRLDRPDQTNRFVSGSLTLRLFRNLDFRALYRRDEQVALLTPDVDGESIEGHLTYTLGLLSLQGRYFEYTRTTHDGQERKNRGFSWSLQRRFGGTLPVYSVERRRGTIR